MNNVFKTLTVSTILVSQLLVAAPALAQTPTASLSHPKNKEVACDKLQEKLEQRINKYRAKRDDHVAKYNTLKERLHKIVNLLKEKGEDTSKLEEYLQGFDGKVENFGQHLDTAFKKLESANDFACGESEGKFKESVKEAKQIFEAVRQDGHDIKEYFRTVIKPEIERLRM